MTNEEIDKIKKKLTGDVKKDLDYLKVVGQEVIKTEKDRTDFYAFCLSYLKEINLNEDNSFYNQYVDAINGNLTSLINKKYSNINLKIKEFKRTYDEIENSLNLSASSTNSVLLCPQNIISTDLTITLYSLNSNIIEIPYNYISFLNEFALLYASNNDIDNSKQLSQKAIDLDRFYFKSFFTRYLIDKQFNNSISIKNDLDRLLDNLVFISKVEFNSSLVEILHTYIATPSKIILDNKADASFVCSKCINFMNDKNIDEKEYLYQFKQLILKEEVISRVFNSLNLSFEVPKEMIDALISLYKEYKEDGDFNEGVDFIKKTLIFHLGKEETEKLLIN